jgi:group I intron endonuclease
MKSGIYKITCLINKRFYIGSAKNLEDRWQRHLSDLKHNKHINIHLQRTYDKYGSNEFKFEVVENCKEEVLLIREQYYLDTLKPYESGFNIGRDASGGDNLTFNPNRDDIIERTRKTINANMLKITEEERREKWGKFGELNPNYGNKWSDDMRKNLADINREKYLLGTSPLCDREGRTNRELYGEEKANEISEKLSKFASTRTGDKNGFFNRRHTEESKEKIRKSRIGKKPTNQIMISINDTIYESYHDASKELGIPVVTIRWRCLSDNPKFKDYKLVG